MNEKILDALPKLDAENDNHWTAEGLPKLEILKFMVGGQVSRDDVETAAPGYTRTNREVTPVVTDDAVSAPLEQKTAPTTDTGDETEGLLLQIRQLLDVDVNPENLSSEDVVRVHEYRSQFTTSCRQAIERLELLFHVKEKQLDLVDKRYNEIAPKLTDAELIQKFHARMDHIQFKINEGRRK